MKIDRKKVKFKFIVLKLIKSKEKKNVDEYLKNIKI